MDPSRRKENKSSDDGRQMKMKEEPEKRMRNERSMAWKRGGKR